MGAKENEDLPQHQAPECSTDTNATKIDNDRIPAGTPWSHTYSVNVIRLHGPLLFYCLFCLLLFLVFMILSSAALTWLSGGRSMFYL
jgi:hypothetical protein